MNQFEKKAPGNLIRKWAVVDAKDISRTETWLEDMAAQGLFFHDFSGWSILAPGPLWIVLLQKDAPRPERRYRLCPTRPQEAEPSQETLELYAQAGWQFLRYWGTSCVSYFLFYSDDPAAPEPYTDPDSLYEALRPPKKDVLNDLLLGGVLYTSTVILRATRILDRQLSFLPNWIFAAAAALLIALWLISLLLNGIDWLTVLALRQEIRRRDTVRPAPPSALFAARCFFSSLLSLLQTGLLAVALALIFTLFRINSDLPLEQFDPDFDLLTLSEMEGDGSWTPEPDLEVADQLLRFNAADVYQDPGRGVQMWYDVSQAGYGTSGGLQHGPELLCLRRRPGRLGAPGRPGSGPAEPGRRPSLLPPRPAPLPAGNRSRRGGVSGPPGRRKLGRSRPGGGPGAGPAVLRRAGPDGLVR